jgi:hypothetical protein
MLAYVHVFGELGCWIIIGGRGWEERSLYTTSLAMLDSDCGYAQHDESNP